MKEKFDIKNNWSGEVQVTAEIECSPSASIPLKLGLAVRWAIAHKADLYGADLNGVKLSCADLTCADLTCADLTCADLTCADLTCAKLSGAKLYCAKLSGAKLYCADLTDADLTDADLTDAKLYDAKLYGAKGLRLPTGELWSEYLTETVPALLVAGGRSLEEVAIPEHWNCQTWDNCPLAAAFRVKSEAEIPILYRPRAKQFIQLFDAGQIPLEAIVGKKDA